MSGDPDGGEVRVVGGTVPGADENLERDRYTGRDLAVGVPLAKARVELLGTGLRRIQMELSAR